MNTKKSAMLLCVDLEKGSRALARYGAELAGRCDQEIHLFYVEPTGGSHVIKDPRACLESLAAEILEGVTIKAFVLRCGIAEEEIMAYAAQFDIAPIVIGRRQRSSVERIYVGSTTSAVISMATCPVLVVPLSREEIL